jgi:hypothetical protein
MWGAIAVCFGRNPPPPRRAARRIARPAKNSASPSHKWVWEGHDFQSCLQSQLKTRALAPEGRRAVASTIYEIASGHGPSENGRSENQRHSAIRLAAGLQWI